MNPDNRNIYVLFYNCKLLEINTNPTPAFLLRNYGKSVRLLKVPVAQQYKHITIDFHKGHLLIVTPMSLYGWNVHQEFNQEYIQNNEQITAADFIINHGQEFDHSYLKVIKMPGQICMIGNDARNDVRWGDVQRHQEQRLVRVLDGSRGV